VLGWVGAWCVALFLGWKRFESATAGDGGPDFERVFLGAARAVLEGTSPYDVAGYVYSPFVAFLLVPIAEQPWARTAWIAVLVAAGLVACLAATLASVRPTHPLHRPLVFVLATGTLFLSWTLSLELWMGQVDVLVLLAVALAMLAAAHGIRGGAGLSLGLAALVKTWPAALVLWLLRRPLRGRGLDWLGVVAAGALAVGLALAVGGVPAVVDMVAAPIRMSSQPLVAYSVWGAGTILFTDSGLAEPVLVSDALSLAVRGALAAWVVGLLVVTLRRPGSPVISLLNVAFVVVLLLPVSHYVYLLLPLPALWWWAARVLETPRRWQPWAVTLVLLAWWYLAMRRIPPGDTYLTTDTQSFLLIFGSTLAAATVSVVAASRLRGAVGAVVRTDRQGAAQPGQPS
jgi:hypothetical protein